MTLTWPAAALAAGVMLAAPQAAPAAPSWRDFPGVANTSYVEPGGDRAIRLSIVVSATPAQCFAAFATTEGFRSWAVPVARVDLRVGGMIESSYDPKAKLGDADNIKNEIVTFIPDELIVLKNVQAPRGFADPDLFQKTVTTITFQAVDAGHTRVTVVNAGYGPGERFTTLLGHFEWGDAYTLAELRKRFETGPTDWSKAAEQSASKKADKTVDGAKP